MSTTTSAIGKPFLELALPCTVRTPTACSNGPGGQGRDAPSFQAVQDAKVAPNRKLAGTLLVGTDNRTHTSGGI